MATGWSNFYVTPATALLPSYSLAHARDWVSLSGPSRTVRSLTAWFTIDATRQLPVSVDVRYWNGTRYVPVRGLDVAWAAGSNQPTTITFDPVRTTRIKLDMTSAAPGTGSGFLQIAELQPSP
jgi:beta-galactosidase